VDVDHISGSGYVGPVKNPAPAETGVIDKESHIGPGPDPFLDPENAGVRGEIRGENLGPDAVPSTQLAAQGFQPVFAAGHEDEVILERRQVMGERRAQTARRARDQGRSGRKLDIHRFILVIKTTFFTGAPAAALACGFTRSRVPRN
jgi:hypothetical protein